MLLPRSSSQWAGGWGKVLAHFSEHYLTSAALDEGLGEPQVSWLGVSLAVTDCKAQVLLGLRWKEMPIPLVLCVFLTLKPPSCFAS